MKTKLLLPIALLFVASCTLAQTSPIQLGPEKSFKYQDNRIYAGKSSPVHPELVRANPDGTCEFRLEQSHGGEGDDPYFKTSARAGEQINEGESDYFGFVIECDASKNSALIRSFDLGSPL